MKIKCLVVVVETILQKFVVCRLSLCPREQNKIETSDTHAECNPPFSRKQREMTLKRVNIPRLNFEYELKLY